MVRLEANYGLNEICNEDVGYTRFANKKEEKQEQMRLGSLVGLG
jgi:hypothetical protein